jgi:hypothetical protein
MEAAALQKEHPIHKTQRFFISPVFRFPFLPFLILICALTQMNRIQSLPDTDPAN